MRIRHLCRLVSDLVAYGFVSRNYSIVLLIVALLVVSAVIVAGQVAAPFIYAIF